MAQKRRALFVFPLIVLVFSILGGFYGPQISAVSAAPASDPAASSAEPSLDGTLENFTHIVSVVEQNEAERPTSEKLYYKGAIPGMLRVLDPHSNFFDPKDFKLLQDDQKGSYFRGRHDGLHAQWQDRGARAVSGVAGLPCGAAARRYHLLGQR